MGARERNCLALERLPPRPLETYFPKLRPDNHQICSCKDPRYNCMAYANGETHRHWTPGWPPGMALYYWPSNIADTLEGWIAIFTAQGFERTNNYDIEPSFEKIAIYVDLEDLATPTHVAKSDGDVWKSKLGMNGHDIEHQSLDLLEGNQVDEYGIVAQVLRRAITC